MLKTLCYKLLSKLTQTNPVLGCTGSPHLVRVGSVDCASCWSCEQRGAVSAIALTLFERIVGVTDNAVF